ncbi:cytochrome o ubiquinol oxidase subunit IV [Labrys sp. La1]|uniref:cytochrome o ubiquinol oxidase subunit IV n=1 Tax=Labrys sp. La1 TaxID=3404917 RepID=UPI003EC04FF0
MSAHTHQDSHQDAHHDEHGSSHGSRKSYLIGFGLSVVLTFIPFWLVMTGALESKVATSLIVISLAVIQIVVHMIYFLHMDAKSEGGWNLMALIFTIVLVVITLTGSLWVMYHLVNNMMPISAHDMRNMP